MFSCLQILEAFLWFVLITLLNVTLIILTLSVSRLLNLLLRLVAFLLFLNPQCLASISRWITASSSWKRFCLFVCRALSSIMVICMLTAIRLLLTFVMSLYKNVSVSCAYTQGKREQFSGFNRTLDAINNVFRKFSAFHDETGRLNVDGMNIISNDGSNKLNRSRKARVSYKVQRTINASLNAATSTRAVSSNPNFVTRQKIEIIFG